MPVLRYATRHIAAITQHADVVEGIRPAIPSDNTVQDSVYKNKQRSLVQFWLNKQVTEFQLSKCLKSILSMKELVNFCWTLHLQMKVKNFIQEWKLMQSLADFFTKAN